MTRKPKSIIGFAVLAALFAGCVHKPKIEQAAEAAPPAEAKAPAPAVESPVPTLGAVHFDFDKSVLKPEDRKILGDNYKLLIGHPDWEVRVQGYCDERGSWDYNMALGSRRAEVVARYYEKMGLDGHRISTVSRGKGDPLCTEHNEACWSKNRRATGDIRPPDVKQSSAR
jgi:peptidoglycan-associated lipoprotein